MTVTRALTAAFAAARIGYATGLVAVPARVATPWIGPSAKDAPVHVPIRALAVRDGLIAGGVLATALGGGAARPWLALCVVADLGDVAATFAAGDSLPDKARPATLGVAGGSALAAALLALAAER